MNFWVFDGPSSLQIRLFVRPKSQKDPEKQEKRSQAKDDKKNDQQRKKKKRKILASKAAKIETKLDAVKVKKGRIKREDRGLCTIKIGGLQEGAGFFWVWFCRLKKGRQRLSKEDGWFYYLILDGNGRIQGGNPCLRTKLKICQGFVHGSQICLCYTFIAMLNKVYLEDTVNHEVMFDGQAEIDELQQGSRIVTLKDGSTHMVWKILMRGVIIENNGDFQSILTLQDKGVGKARILTPYGELKLPITNVNIERGDEVLKVSYLLNGDQFFEFVLKEKNDPAA